jgi:hypothetical protein
VIRQKKHIAIVLFAIFIVPIAFQPLHMVWHHSNDSHCHHTCCHSEATENSIKPTLNPESKKENHCPVCEFHFAIIEIPNNTVFKPVKQAFECSVTGLETRLSFSQIISVKSPRAPPMLS